MLRFIIVILSLCIFQVDCQFHFGFNKLSQIKIGGLFENIEQEQILKQAVEEINRDKNILLNHQLLVKSEFVHSANSFYATTKVCNLLNDGVIGIFGPENLEIESHAQCICDRYDIPYIETHWDFRTRQDKYHVNVFPHPDTLDEAFSNFVDDEEWTEFAILYDKDESIFKLQGLIKSSLTQHRRNIIIRQLPSNDNENYRPILKSLQRDYYLKNIIIDCNVKKTIEVLKQAQEIGMIRYDYIYLLTTLDIQPWDLEIFKHGDAQIVAFRMVGYSNSELLSITGEFISHKEKISNRNQHSELSTKEALLYDAVKLFSKALEDNIGVLDQANTVKCGEDRAWEHGLSIINSMRSMSPFEGMTGTIQFNNTGFRTDVILDVVTLTQMGVVKAGTWDYGKNSKSRFGWTIPDVSNENPEENDGMPLRNRTLTVITIMSKPFCMYALSEEPLSGNKRFVGYTVDLLEIFSKDLGFNYNIKLVDDGTHEGMITEMNEEKGHMVVGDLSITKEREEKVDFTHPFMHLGIAILFTQPQAKPPNLFSFMSPFAYEVWILTAIGFVGVSLILFVVGRMTPYEWDNPLPCVSEPEYLYNQFSLPNCFWFTIGSIMQQGSDLAPKAASTRIIAGTWWFYTLIMVSSYTANLATFLIVQDKQETFTGLQALANSNIDYGCVANGSTSRFFEDTKDPIKRKIWNHMVETSSWKTSNDDGINAVREKPGKFAFFMESTVIEYYIERKCGLEQIGGLLDHKGYGIALPKDSPYLNLFNAQILQKQEKGELDRLKRKWWKDEGKEEAEQCPQLTVSDTVKPLKLSNVGGVFVVLVCGCIIAVLVTLIEYISRNKKMKKAGESLRLEIMKDLQYALQCRGNVKPVRKTSEIANNQNEENKISPT